MFKKKTVRQKLKDAKNDGIRDGLNREARRHQKEIKTINENHEKEIRLLKQEYVRKHNRMVKRESVAEQTRLFWEQEAKRLDIRMQEMMAFGKRTDRLVDNILKLTAELAADKKEIEEMHKEIYSDTKKAINKVRYIV